MEHISTLGLVVLILVMTWVALELRSLQETVLPVAALANSPILQSLAGPVS